MKNIEPVNQIKLFGLDKYFKELVILDKNNRLPNKIMLSGPKGQGKSTLAYHFINYILSKDEEFKYDILNFEINSENHTFKTPLNLSLQNTATEVLRKGLIDYDRRKGWRGPLDNKKYTRKLGSWFRF